MTQLNEMTLRVPVTRPTDLVLFEEQDRAERHYRSLYPSLQDATHAAMGTILAPLDLASEYVAQAEASTRGMMHQLAAEVRLQNNRSPAGPDRTAARLHGLTLLDEVRENADRILAVHTNVALTGRAAADAALAATWHTNIVLPGNSVARFTEMMRAYHAYYLDRRSAWLARLAEILNVPAGCDVDSLDVSWVAISWASSDWLVANVPSGWDLGSVAGEQP